MSSINKIKNFFCVKITSIISLGLITLGLFLTYHWQKSYRNKRKQFFLAKEICSNIAKSLVAPEKQDLSILETAMTNSSLKKQYGTLLAKFFFIEGDYNKALEYSPSTDSPFLSEIFNSQRLLVEHIKKENYIKAFEQASLMKNSLDKDSFPLLYATNLLKMISLAKKINNQEDFFILWQELENFSGTEKMLNLLQENCNTLKNFFMS